MNGVEVWRGGVNPWECDSMGHLNVRFYVARASEGLAGLAGALGMPRAFTRESTATLQVREHHIRFVREARPDDALHMTGGVVSMGEADAQVLLLLVHSGSGDVSAAIQARVAHVTPHEQVAFAWPERIVERARELTLEVPAAVRPRSLQPGGSAPSGNLARAIDLKLPSLSSGVVRAQDCDVFGRLDAEGFMARISDGYSQWVGAGPQLGAPSRTKDGPRIGGAAVEMRLAYAAWPRAGDRIELRSGLKAVTPKTQTVVHWMLDPLTGQPWAAAEHVFVGLDLDARKLAEFPPQMVAAMQDAVVPGLTV
jgi:acyl-CoA thioester hydrolase